MTRDAGATTETRPPPRAALSAQTWREFGYLLSSFPLDIIGFCYVAAWLACGVPLSITIEGLAMVAAGLVGCSCRGKW